jgi:hypothetical protein
MKEGTTLGARAQSAIQRAAVLYKPRLATFNFFNIINIPPGLTNRRTGVGISAEERDSLFSLSKAFRTLMRLTQPPLELVK